MISAMTQESWNIHPPSQEWYSFYTYSGFAFDPIKSLANKAKHGIDFIEAQRLWQDEDRVIIPARSVLEPRMAVIGRIGTNIWTVIHVLREEKVRIISARRARHEEKEFYRKRAKDDDG
jgi:uncharacterized protein